MTATELATTLAACDAAGLSKSCVRTLCHLHLHKGGIITPVNLSTHLGMSSASVTGIGDNLLAMGYIDRSAHPSDRRKLVLSINPAGTAALLKILSASS